MPRIPPSDDDGPFGPAEPPELSEAAKQALARQQKLDDANFITERTLAFKNEMAAEFERSKRDGGAADPMFEPNIMKFGFEMRSSLLADIPRGPRGRLISQDAIEKTRSNMEGTMERFSTAALHRLNLERHSRAFANIEAAGEEFAKAAGRDARGLQSLLITVDNLMDRYEGVFADGEIAGQRARLRTGTVIAAINGLIEQGKTGFARELIQKGAFDPDLGDQPARLLLDRIDKTEKDNAFKAAEETVRARRLAVAEIGLRARKGQLFPAELDATLAQGTIGPEEHAGFLAALERFKDDRARRIEGKERINELLARRQKPDETDRAAVDAVFESLARAFDEHPPDARALIEDDYVRRTGMLPLALRDRLIGGMLSEDPAVQVAAAGRIVRLGDIEPTVGDDIPDDTLTRARTINAFAYPGLAPARTVQLADERIAREAQKAAAEDEIKGGEDHSPDVLEDEPELEVLDEPEAIPPGAAGDSQDRTVIVIRNPQTGEVQEVTEAQLEQLIGLAEDPETKTEKPSDDTATEIAELVLSVLPGTGEVLAARDSYLAFRAAQEALENDDLQEALLKGGESALNALGAIPILGGVIRAPKAVAKAASLLVKLLGRARRMTRIGGRRKPTIDELEGKIAPTRNFPRKVQKKIDKLAAKRDEIRAQRLAAPKGSREQARLLDKQQQVQAEIARTTGSPWEKQSTKFLRSHGFEVDEKKISYATPYGRTVIDKTITKKGKLAALTEDKTAKSVDRALQRKKQEWVAGTLGVPRIFGSRGKCD